VFADGFESGDTSAWSATVPLAAAIPERERRPLGRLLYVSRMTPGFWLTHGTVLAGAADCWHAVARDRREAKQSGREVARLEAKIEKARQAFEDERRRQRLGYDPPENVVDFWRG